MGILLYIIAQIITPFFNILGMFYAIIFIRFKSWKEFDKYFKDLAISKDQYSNVAVQYMFNDWMLKKSSRTKFGNVDETISSVFGKNKKLGTLNNFGYFWGLFLNRLEEDHVENAIEEDEISKF